MGESTGKGGVLANLALVPLGAGLGNWQIALSESQERFLHAIKRKN
jgi:phosphoribosylformylglycinamidine (FGAM) synthase-like enzyme